MEKKVYDLIIDPELRDAMTHLRESEMESLTRQIISEGCRDPLVVWNGVIVDGHNRYSICHEYNIPFEYVEMDFGSKEKAKLWMADNQLSRRNMNVFQKCEVIVPLEEPIKAQLEEEAEKRRREKISEFRKGVETGGKCRSSEKTMELIARKADTSERTYKKAKYVIQEGDPETIRQVEEGAISINKAFTDLKKNNRIPEPEDTEEKQETPDEQEGFSLGTPIDVPTMREPPKRVPRPYEYVKQQVTYSVKNMLDDMQVGLYWLRNEDFGKKKELRKILKEGYEQALALVDELEEIR